MKKAMPFVRLRGGRWHDTFSVTGETRQRTVETLCGVVGIGSAAEFTGEEPFRSTSCKRCLKLSEKEK